MSLGDISEGEQVKDIADTTEDEGPLTKRSVSLGSPTTVAEGPKTEPGTLAAVFELQREDVAQRVIVVAPEIGPSTVNVPPTVNDPILGNQNILPRERLFDPTELPREPIQDPYNLPEPSRGVPYPGQHRPYARGKRPEGIPSYVVAGKVVERLASVYGLRAAFLAAILAAIGIPACNYYGKRGEFETQLSEFDENLDSVIHTTIRDQVYELEAKKRQFPETPTAPKEQSFLGHIVSEEISLNGVGDNDGLKPSVHFFGPKVDFTKDEKLITYRSSFFVLSGGMLWVKYDWKNKTFLLLVKTGPYSRSNAMRIKDPCRPTLSQSSSICVDKSSDDSRGGSPYFNYSLIKARFNDGGKIVEAGYRPLIGIDPLPTDLLTLSGVRYENHDGFTTFTNTSTLDSLAQLHGMINDPLRNFSEKAIDGGGPQKNPLPRRLNPRANTPLDSEEDGYEAQWKRTREADLKLRGRCIATDKNGNCINCSSSHKSQAEIQACANSAKKITDREWASNGNKLTTLDGRELDCSDPEDQQACAEEMKRRTRGGRF